MLFTAPVARHSVVEFAVIGFIGACFGSFVFALAARSLRNHPECQQITRKTCNILIFLLGVVFTSLTLFFFFNSLSHQDPTLLSDSSFFGAAGLMALFFSDFITARTALLIAVVYVILPVISAFAAKDTQSSIIVLITNLVVTIVLYLEVKFSGA